MVIDMHSHVIPMGLLDRIRRGDPDLEAMIKEEHGVSFVVHHQGYSYPLLPGFVDNEVEARLQAMDRAGIDLAVVSVAPPLFYYWLPAELSLSIAQAVNDAIAQLVQKCPHRLLGMATVPLQDPRAAAMELERAKIKLGLRGVHIGANVEGKQLDDRVFRAFFEKAAQLKMPIFLHPYYIGNKAGLEKYYLTNLLGNPIETTIAACHLIFGGILADFPDLKICLAHGGGFLPYQIGRLRHGHRVRPEPKSAGLEVFSTFEEQIYFDTLLFDDRALRFLLDSVGASKVMLGTDYPFDMGERNPVARIRRLGLSRWEEKLVLAENARKFFGI